jgi:hypothetical protein
MSFREFIKARQKMQDAVIPSLVKNILETQRKIRIQELR